MKLHQLRVFVTVVEQGSLHGAARALGLSPPAMTATIRELEKMLGVPLLVRSVNGVKLTEFGTVFLRRARLLIGDMRRTQEELLAMRDQAGSKLSLAVSPVVACALLPKAFIAFRTAMPGTSVAFRESPLPAALNAVRDGEIDFAVLNATSGMRWPDFIEAQDIMSIPLMLVARQGHPLSRTRSLARLLESEWLLPCEPGDDTDKAFIDYFERKGLAAPSRILRCQSLFPTVMLLRTMDLIGVITEPTFRQEMKLHKISALRMTEHFPSTIVSIVARRDRPLTSAAALFLSCIGKTVQSYPPAWQLTQ